LVGGTSKKQNWKGLGIAFIVIAVVCLLITAAILLTTIRKFFINDLIQIPSVFIGQSTSHHNLIEISDRDIFNVKVPKP
jgi:hypothetical protein